MKVAYIMAIVQPAPDCVIFTQQQIAGFPNSIFPSGLNRAFSQPSTGVPQIFVVAFIRTQHLLDRIGQEIQGEKPISQLQILLCRL
jgi:hypothetical protein